MQSHSLQSPDEKDKWTHFLFTSVNSSCFEEMKVLNALTVLVWHFIMNQHIVVYFVRVVWVLGYFVCDHPHDKATLKSSMLNSKICVYLRH